MSSSPDSKTAAVVVIIVITVLHETWKVRNIGMQSFSSNKSYYYIGII